MRAAPALERFSRRRRPREAEIRAALWNGRHSDERRSTAIVKPWEIRMSIRSATRHTVTATLVVGGLGLAGALAVSPAMANNLSYAPTTTMPVLNYPGYVFSINKINDGDTTAMNGFASSRPTGTISMTLEKCAVVKSFTIHNNINGTTNGVKTFDLHYYGSNGHLIASQLSLSINNNAPPQTTMAPTWTADGLPYVHRIDMVIKSSFDKQVEIREIVLDGKSGDCCP